MSTMKRLLLSAGLISSTICGLAFVAPGTSTAREVVSQPNLNPPAKSCVIIGNNYAFFMDGTDVDGRLISSAGILSMSGDHATVEETRIVNGNVETYRYSGYAGLSSSCTAWANLKTTDGLHQMSLVLYGAAAGHILKMVDTDSDRYLNLGGEAVKQ